MEALIYFLVSIHNDFTYGTVQPCPDCGTRWKLDIDMECWTIQHFKGCQHRTGDWRLVERSARTLPDWWTIAWYAALDDVLGLY